MVRLTKIYTKTGDKGETSLGDGSRVLKTHARILAFGTVDELNAALGVVLALSEDTLPGADRLAKIQNDLFDVGADLCVPPTTNSPSPELRVTEAQVQQLETWIDEWNEALPALESFILPGGSRAAALLHAARTVCRRAEREVLLLSETDGEEVNPTVLTYLNRLSDLLFVLSRAANRAAGIAEPLWTPGG